MIDVQAWIFIAALCFLGEMLTVSFFLLWFGVGASVSAVLSYLGFDPLTQFIAFIIISIIFLALSRPFAARITKDSPKKATSERLIGQKGLVIEELSPEKGGIVKVEGDTWRAISSQTIKEGKYVFIKEIRGVKLIVEPFKSLDDDK